MQDMMKMYGMTGMDPSMFGGQETLILNAKHPLVQYILKNGENDNTSLFCEQLYDLAMISHKPLSPDEMTKFVSRSNQIMMLLANDKAQAQQNAPLIKHAGFLEFTRCPACFFLLFYFTISDPDDRIILFALLKNKENHMKGLVFISMKKGKPSALLPIAVFLVFYLGLGIYSEYILKIPMGFYNIPIVVAFLAAILVACLQNRSVPFEEKLALMGQGIGDKTSSQCC